VPLNLTLGMRILLHLSEYDDGRTGFDTPPQVTQQGIAEALSVRQSDVSRSLAGLKVDGNVEEKSSSVGPGRAGRKQRLKVYSLTGRGRDMAHSICSRILELEVAVPPPSGNEPARRIPLGEVNSLLGTAYSALRLADMVAADGTLILAPPAPSVSPQGAPQAAQPLFLDRRRELGVLLHKVREGPEVLISVVGIPGVGKTALARKLISELGDRRPIYFQVREWPCFGMFLQALRDFLVKHGRRRLAGLLNRPGSPPTEEAAGSVLRDIEGLGAVLVLDDFHHAGGQPELRHFVRQMLDMPVPHGPVARILLFSCSSPELYDRRDIALEGRVWELQLGGLDEESSRDLAARVGIPKAAIDATVAAAHGHPLSIQLLRGMPGAPIPFQDALRFLQEDVIGGIPANERSLLQMLSVLRRPEDRKTVLGLSDDPLAYDALSALVSRSLVLLSREKYEVHEMVREGAYGRIPEPARKAFHLRAAAHYLKGVSTESGVEAVHHLCRAGENERAAQLLLSLGGELMAEGRLEECRFLLDMVDSKKTARTEGLRRLRQDLLAEYGEWDMGFEYLVQCDEQASVSGLRPKHPGYGIRSEREWQVALDDHERGLLVLDRVGDVAGRCELLSSLGWIRLMRGEYREASAAYRSIGRFSARRGCREPSLKADAGLGHLARLQGKRDEAARLFRKVLGRLGPSETGMEIACLNYLALLAGSKNGLNAAVSRLETALTRCGTGRHRRERAYTLLHMGQILSKGGDRSGARKSLSSALAEFRGIGDQHGTLFAIMALAVEALVEKNFEEAERMAGEALREPAMGQLEAAREHAAWISAAAAKGGALK
jgi:tetratricopeptide (TPR) repeat protein/DNA-binding MarR family transcriptional regulator